MRRLILDQDTSRRLFNIGKLFNSRIRYLHFQMFVDPEYTRKYKNEAFASEQAKFDRSEPGMSINLGLPKLWVKTGLLKQWRLPRISFCRPQYEIEGVEALRRGADGGQQALVTWQGFSAQTWEALRDLPNISGELADLRGQELAKAEKQLAKVLEWEEKLKVFTVRCQNVIPKAQAIVQRAKERKTAADGLRDAQAAA